MIHILPNDGKAKWNKWQHDNSILPCNRADGGSFTAAKPLKRMDTMYRAIFILDMNLTSTSWVSYVDWKEK